MTIKKAVRLALLTLASTPVPALAQPAAPAGPPAEADVLPQVTVTAERRETVLQRTPVTVNAVGADQLDQRGIRQLNDLGGIAAGVGVPTQWIGTQSIFIRGIGTSRSIGNPSVGLYLDDVYIPRLFGSGYYGSLPDIERLEILHGPQGTLYGQNTSAGALRMLSRLPAAERYGWISAGIGNQSAYELRGYGTGALSPVLNASIAYAHREQDGDVYNATLGRRVNAVQNDQARAQFLLTPNASFNALLAIDGMIGRSDTQVPSPLNYPGSARRVTFSNIDPRGSYDGGGASLKLTGRLNDRLTVKSITAARGYDTSMPTDIDGLPTDIQGFTQDLVQRQFSQEFQLVGDYGRFNFITGLAFFSERFEVDRHSWSSGRYSILKSDSGTRSVGLYGQGTYRLTEALGVTLGLRVNHERKELDSASYASDVARTQLGETYAVDGLHRSYRATTPKVALHYQWTQDLLTYASWAKGETSGGFNPIGGTLAVARVPIDPEKVTAYELGIKHTGWGGRVRSNAALFYNDYTGYQASISNPIIDGVIVPGGVIVNAGKAHTYGLEFDTAVKPTPRFEAGLSLTYLRTEFDQFANPTGAASSDFVGQDLPFAPRFSAAISLNYRHPLPDAGALRVNVNVRRETGSYSDVSANREFTKFPAQTYVNGGVFYTSAQGEWTIALTVKNLLNKTYALPLSGYSPTLNLNGVAYSAPRLFLLSVRRDFL